MFKAVQRRYYRRPLKLRQSDRAEILVLDKAAQSVYSQQCLIASQKQFISVTICSYWMESSIAGPESAQLQWDLQHRTHRADEDLTHCLDYKIH